MNHWERMNAGVAYISDKSVLEEQMQASLKNMYICHSTPYFIECLPLGIDKGTALEELAAHLGISMQDVVAFGDSNNDAAMLRAVGTAVVMGNADPAVKEIADIVAASNEEDGVAQVIEQMLL